MKIAHIADIHLGMGYPGPNPESRFDDIVRTSDWCADRMIQEKVDLVLFAGDAFKDSKVFLDRASLEIKAFAAWLRKLSGAGIEVVVISGTPSHDAISAYELVKEMAIPNVHVYTRSGLCTVKGLQVACLPGLDRKHIVTKEQFRDMTPHDIHVLMTQLLKDQCWGLRAKCNDENPSILLSHMTYLGSDTGFDEFLLEHEPVLMPDAVSSFDLVCLGHIHRHQGPVGDQPVYYSGAPERLSFNDELETPGFWIHELNCDTWEESRFIHTPARRFLTVEFIDDEEGLFKTLLKDPAEAVNLFGKVVDPVRDAIVRVRYTCTEEENKQIDRRVLEKSLYNAGAFYVTEIKVNVDRIERSRDREVTESLAPVEAVGKWGINQEFPQEEIEQLQSMTAVLIEEVQL